MSDIGVSLYRTVRYRTERLKICRIFRCRTKVFSDIRCPTSKFLKSCCTRSLNLLTPSAKIIADFYEISPQPILALTVKKRFLDNFFKWAIRKAQFLGQGTENIRILWIRIRTKIWTKKSEKNSYKTSRLCWVALKHFSPELCTRLFWVA
jgi:hypothetical protein